MSAVLFVNTRAGRRDQFISERSSSSKKYQDDTDGEEYSADHQLRQSYSFCVSLAFPSRLLIGLKAVDEIIPLAKVNEITEGQEGEPRRDGYDL